MSDKMRWRYGDTNPVIAAVDADTVIEIGDLLWLDVDDAKPAEHQSNQVVANNTCTQETFAAKFLGIAMQRSRAGDCDPIRVATTGVFELECGSDKFELGDLVGVASQSDGNLWNQRVTKSQHAIGRVARREPTASTTVLVDIRSTVMTGGV